MDAIIFVFCAVAGQCQLTLLNSYRYQFWENFWKNLHWKFTYSTARNFFFSRVSYTCCFSPFLIYTVRNRISFCVLNVESFVSPSFDWFFFLSFFPSLYTMFMYMYSAHESKEKPQLSTHSTLIQSQSPYSVSTTDANMWIKYFSTKSV